MIRIALILLLCVYTASAQRFYTNEPELIYPAMEKFIAENHNNNTQVLEKLQSIDSILVQRIAPVKNTDGTYRIIFGYRHSNWIEIHPFVIKYPKMFEAVFIHELGHVLGLKHIDTNKLPAGDPLRNEIMAHPRSGLITEENFQKVREKYYADLHRLLMTEIKN